MTKEKTWIIYTEKNGILGTVPKSEANTILEATQIWAKEYLFAKCVDKNKVKVETCTRNGNKKN